MSELSFDAEAGCLAIAGDFNIYHAGKIKQGLQQALASGRLRSLNLENVSEFDCAGLQLLLSIGPGIAIEAVSEPVAVVLELLRLDAQMLTHRRENRSES